MEDKKVVFVAQEISFAKILASNDKGTRERGVKKLGKWLKARMKASYEFTEDDLMRVWKGLFYCMWMSDKPLVQEEMAENISKLVHAVDDSKFVVMFVRCFFNTMSREWLGIDHYRLDKFLMLVRRVVRQALVFCSQRLWSPEVVISLCDVFSGTVLSSWPTRSLTMHFCEIFNVELAKVGKGRLSVDTMHQFLKPFVVYIATEKEELLRSHVVEHVFHYLIRQSEFGQDCEAKFEAWKSAGFPGSSWKNMELVEEGESEEECPAGEEEEDSDEGDAVTDPRAGSVHVELKLLLFEPVMLADMLLQQRALTFEVQNRKTLKCLADDFTEMSKGKYPLKLGSFGKKNKFIREIRKSFKRKRHTLKVTKRLLEFENRLKQEKGISKSMMQKLERGEPETRNNKRFPRMKKFARTAKNKIKSKSK